MYFEFLILLRSCRVQPVCLPVIQAPAHSLNQTTPKHWQFYSLLLGSSTLVSARAPCLGSGADGLQGDSAAAGQLHPTRRRHDQLSAHQQHQPQPTMQCALRTGVQVGAWASSNDELQDIQAILPSSSSEILSER